MTVEEKVQAVLVADAGVTALVPAGRIKVQGDWQGLTLPYIVHFPVSVKPIHTMEEMAGLKSWPFYQISIFSASYSTAAAVATAVRALLGHANFDGVQFMWQGQDTYDYEEDVRVHQIAQQYVVWEALS